MQKELKIERAYKHPIAKAWEALSDAEKITEWFIKADFKPEVGYKYTFIHEDTKILGEVKAVDKPNLLSYTWMVEGSGVDSLVTYKLSEKDGVTTLVIEHVSDDDVSDNPAIAPMFMEFEKGWENVHDQLEKFLN